MADNTPNSGAAGSSAATPLSMEAVRDLVAQLLREHHSASEQGSGRQQEQAIPAHQLPVDRQARAGGNADHSTAFSAAADNKPALPFVDVKTYRDGIQPGYNVYPKTGAPLQPHIFNLEDDFTFRAISAAGQKAALDEYKILACIGLFLSSASKQLEYLVDDLRQQLHPDDSLSVLPFDEVANTVHQCDCWLRTRLAFIRFPRKDGGAIDKAFVELAGANFFHEDISDMGSSDLVAFHKMYLAEQRRSAVQQAAKASAKARINPAQKDSVPFKKTYPVKSPKPAPPDSA